MLESGMPLLMDVCLSVCQADLVKKPMLLCVPLAVLEQSICNRLQGDEIVLEWVAFSTTRNGLKLSVDALDQFEHEVS